jgi:ribosome-binding protein aMBF1 (putative translation factor)
MSFEHQQWAPTVLQKSSVKQVAASSKSSAFVSAASSVSKPVDALDMSDQPIKYFTQAMGNKIAALRTAKGWTQEQLAQQMREPKNKIQSLERGKELYNGPFVAKLKKVLGNFSW